MRPIMPTGKFWQHMDVPGLSGSMGLKFNGVYYTKARSLLGVD